MEECALPPTLPFFHPSTKNGAGRGYFPHDSSIGVATKQFQQDWLLPQRESSIHRGRGGGRERFQISEFSLTNAQVAGLFRDLDDNDDLAVSPVGTADEKGASSADSGLRFHLRLGPFDEQ
jgi:hypothetical protein